MANASKTSGRQIFSLGSKPIFDLGFSPHDPEQEFTDRNGFLAAIPYRADGYIVADKVALKYFDSNGRLTRVVGRKGEGPGEFGQITTICQMPGDSIVAYDSRRQAMTIIDANGGIVRRVILTGNVPTGGCLQDGTVLVEQAVGVTPQLGIPIEAILRVDLRGKSFGEVTRTVATDGYPFIRLTTVVGVGDGVLVGDATRSTFEVYNVSGSRRMVVTTADLPEQISQADLTIRLTASAPRRLPGPTGRGFAIRVPRTKQGSWPAYGRILRGTGGVLWMEDYPRPGAGFGWTSFSSDGELLGRLVITEVAGLSSFYVTGFDRGGVYFRGVDTLGVPHVIAYPLEVMPLNRDSTR